MDTIKVPALKRELAVEGFAIRKEDTTYRLSFSAASDYPVERYFGTEVLDFGKGAVRLDRASRGAMPLLFNHNMDAPLGMIDSASIADGRMLVAAHLFDTPAANDVRAMIEGGLRNVSIGYRLHEVTEANTGKDAGVQRITDWEPYEVSIVTVPADPTVGIGRAQGGEEFEVRMVRAEKPPATPVVITVESRKMSEQQAAPGGNGEQPQHIGAVEAERERREAIINLCKSNKIDNRVQSRWIETGAPLTAVAKEILDVMEERGKSAPVANTEVGLSRKETQKYSVFRAIRALRYGSQDSNFLKDAAFEIECSRQVAKQVDRIGSTGILVPGEVLTRPVDLSRDQMRAMSVVPGSKGGYMVDIMQGGFIDILRNRSVAMRMGARQLSGLSGNIVFPRQTAKPSVTWQAGEGVSVTAADQTLGQLSMTPKTCIAITDVSEQLLRQATPSAEAFVMADLANDVAIDGVDNAVINGTGGAQPVGIKNTSGITSGQDASSATYAKILAFVSTAGALNAILGNPGFVTTTAGAARLMQVQRFTSTDTPLWEGNMLDGTCVGFNAMSSEQLASANLIFGSWDTCVIGDWGVLELSTDNGGTRFNQAQVGIRALWMVDVMIRYPTAWVVGTNLS
jgi:HK97 family phage major capsid protein/HK97 family phage prohead protease